jgi:hypothetical protein
MQRVWPIIAVKNVPGSARWYERLLGIAEPSSGDESFAQVVSSDCEVLVCLNVVTEPPRGANRWPGLRQRGSPDNGVVLWFVVADFDSAWQRAQDMGARVIEQPNRDNGTGLRAFVILDPDDYAICVNESGV